MIGPALGGLLLAAVGSPGAFGADAVSFVFSACCLIRLSSEASATAPGGATSVWQDIRTGLGYVRSQVWLWGTFVAATFTYLLFLGPTYVLVPYLVKNRTCMAVPRRSVIVLGLGGLGALLAAAVTAQIGDR